MRSKILTNETFMKKILKLLKTLTPNVSKIYLKKFNILIKIKQSSDTNTSAHCVLALKEQFFGQPFHIKFHIYLLAISTDLTFWVFSVWVLPEKDHTLGIKWLYIYIYAIMQYQDMLIHISLDMIKIWPEISKICSKRKHYIL